MEYRRIKDQDKEGDAVHDDVESLRAKSRSGSPSTMVPLGGSTGDRSKWKLKSIVTLALTVLTSSQAILIVWSKRAGKYEYSVTTANFLVEALKCALSLAALARIWKMKVLRMITDAPGYQILKNLNIISTGVLYRIILKKKLSEIQWAAFVLLSAGCTTAQLNSNSDRVLQTPFQGWLMAIVMALLSGFAGVYTEAIIKKRPSRNINVQNFWFGMELYREKVQDGTVSTNFLPELFAWLRLLTFVFLIDSVECGIAVSMVMKYADNIVKVYSTSVAMLLTAVVSVFLFGFHLSLAFFLGSTVVSVSVYLHSIGKLQR
ncbi:UNVERIFIED_CONTAM: CMP-sialic acid transporter 2 [Sesamum calycinum]|uniref:CMP-sialic acid transporter 2 n=1 Tax=Sesamum calycinum TaxID=2727403 RepID=A0AAW2PJX6_9LAMI